MEINFDKLRSDLLDYLGSASSYNPVAIVYLGKIENASDNELISYAQEFGFNLDNYIIGSSRKLI